MRTALIGANGQLGQDLRTELQDCIALERPHFDVTDAGGVGRVLDELRPRLVINCAALTHVDQCERDPAAAIAVNALGARNVALACERIGAVLVYVSTDYVFGAAGTRRTPYTETDAPGPMNVYGVSKLAGEHFSLGHCSRTYVVRTSGLYGHAGARGKGGNFVETMLRLADEGKPLRVVDDQRLSPTSTRQIAPRILALAGSGAFGLYHMAAADHCTWCEFAREIFALSGRSVAVTPIPSSDYPLPARRPAMSALVSDRLRATGIEPYPGWREMLGEYLRERRRER